jgi:hypothetical protein
VEFPDTEEVLVQVQYGPRHFSKTWLALRGPNESQRPGASTLEVLVRAHPVEV